MIDAKRLSEHKELFLSALRRKRYLDLLLRETTSADVEAIIDRLNEIHAEKVEKEKAYSEKRAADVKALRDQLSKAGEDLVRQLDSVIDERGDLIDTTLLLELADDTLTNDLLAHNSLVHKPRYFRLGKIWSGKGRRPVEFVGLTEEAIQRCRVPRALKDAKYFHDGVLWKGRGRRPEVFKDMSEEDLERCRLPAELFIFS